jgi:two-component system, sensor histidine kinase and response regulator
MGTTPASANPTAHSSRSLLSTFPAGPREHGRAGAMLAISVIVFLACAPFAKVALDPLPGFLPAYQAAIVLAEVVTAVLLFGQFAIRGAAGLLVLGCAYLFSACMAALHLTSFPGLFLPAGLPGRGSQTTAWLYFLWHAGFPAAILAYSLLPGSHEDRRLVRRPALGIALGIAAVLAAAGTLGWLATGGQFLLPALMEGDRDAPPKFIVASACWLLSIATLPLLWRRKPHSALDLWLLVVMCAWIFEVALAAVLNGGRYDLGWYAGRIYGLLAGSFVLIVLLLDNAMLYSELARAHGAEQARSEELRQAKALAEAATHAKAQFLANMSHEIRTPMNAILGLTQLALKGDLPQRQRDYLDKSLRAGRHLLGVLNDVLDLSKAEAGKLTVESLDFNLEQTLANVGEMVSEKAGEKGLELVIDIAKDVPQMLIGDPLRLSQILVNLANNAVKFTDQGEVALACRVRDDTPEGVLLEFEVTDTGIGIPEDQCRHLFKSFQQADDSITRRFGGTGLGLAISARLVMLMDGEIGVRSEPGSGSTFWFTVRMARSAQQSRRAAPDSLRGKRILVVDDHEHARTVVVQMLETMGFDAADATSGEAALRLVADTRKAGRPFDAVLLDWQMPGMDGIETARRIRGIEASAPALILVTAFSREEVVSAARSAGVDDVLAKPVSPSLLLDALMAALHRTDPQPGAWSGPGAEASPAPPGRGVRLLLVEDHALNREVARGLLALHGVEVDEAVDGGQAVAMLRDAPAGRWQAVLMDMQMPVLDGLEASRAIRQMEQHRALPIIAMTANVMLEDRGRCLEAGMNDHLAKPIIEEELQRVLDRWVGARASEPVAEGPQASETVRVLPAVPNAPGPGAAADLDEALARLEKAVAHDLRAGLGVMTGFGKLLAARLVPLADARVAGQFDSLQESGLELVRLVDGWRQASLILRRPMTRQMVDMPALARRAASDVGAGAVRFDFDDGLPAVQADAELVLKIWCELLGNAVKFTHQGETPWIEAWGRVQDGVPVFGVRDRGIGIPATEARRLFQPMQRLHGDTYPGVGLGLFVASGLAARHGGRMWVEATEAGGETSVCFALSPAPGG